MDWKIYKNEKPPLNEKVLVYRSKAKKYMVAYLHNSMDIRDGVKKHYWLNEYSTCLAIEIDDAWIKFPYYITDNETGNYSYITLKDEITSLKMHIDILVEEMKKLKGNT